MNTESPPLNAAEIGERLRRARDNAQVTQASAAAAIEVARTTIIAIEQGTRKPRLAELQKLAFLYGTSVNALLRSEAVQVDLVPRFRRDHDAGGEVADAAALLNNLVKAEVELENLLGVQRLRNDPPERPLLPGDVYAQAERDAQDLRQWLGLGSGPIRDMVSLLELELGLRVYVRHLSGKVSGLYAFDERVGGCILLNASHKKYRRAQTGAHELGHYISARAAPDALLEGGEENSREERYAVMFARAFLTPARAVALKFRDITAGSNQLNRRHVILLAGFFGVSREAMVRRLEELKLVRGGSWDWFVANGGITDEQVRDVLGDAAFLDQEKVDAARPVSARMGVLASEAWRRDFLSEGQLANLLQIDRVEARDLIDTYETEGGAASGALDLPS
jgi:Zn-dependent peptidase ImmA (M78 family)/DNA-binding XRE family transcriptional regulator